jgi:hypothetical protein
MSELTRIKVRAKVRDAIDLLPEYIRNPGTKRILHVYFQIDNLFAFSHSATICSCQYNRDIIGRCDRVVREVGVSKGCCTKEPSGAEV